MKIYFAGSIRGGREDSAVYLQIVSILVRYGTVLTGHMADAELSDAGEELSDIQIHDPHSVRSAMFVRNKKV